MNAYLIDRDGVLTRAGDSAPIAGSVEWFNRLVAKGTPCLVASNHTTSSPEDAAARLNRVGFNITPEMMHTPLTILWDIFQKNTPERILVSGTDQLKLCIQNAGFHCVDSGPADVLLMGFHRQISYQDLMKAIDVVVNHGAKVIALHENRLFRDENRVIEPGLGAWVKAVEHAANVQALIVGKPSRYYYETALARLDSRPEETVMISDDPLGDLAGACRAGLKTVFVTSGKYADPKILEQLPPEEHPDRILPSLSDL